VPGLIPSRPVLPDARQPPVPGRHLHPHREQLDYLEEPDIFHDVFGHVPLLATPAYADYMAEYGRIGLEAVERKGVKFLARLNWYTIEFGLIRTPQGVQVYGAGICSSYGEARYVVEDPSAHWLGFDLERVLRTGYYIDDLQASYFVIDSFEDLFRLLQDRDWPALYDRMREAPPLTPFEVAPEDRVIRQGTGAYWRDFPATKAKLK
jgi:phenylalanine-4-hydroxylase